MYEHQALGDLGENVFKRFGLALKKFNYSTLEPLKAAKKNPGSLFNLKLQYKMGKNMGKNLEAVTVTTNPLNPTLQKFNQKGIEHGGIGKFLGNTGEKARENPLATTAIVAAVVVAAGAAAGGSAGGSGSAGAAGGMSSGEVAAATEGAAAATETGGILSTVTGTVSEYAGYVSAVSGVAKTASGLMSEKKSGNNEIDPFAYDALMAEQDRQAAEAARAGSGGGFFTADLFSTQNILLAMGLGALTVAGYIMMHDRDSKLNKRS